jgi:hypothetical protein
MLLGLTLLAWSTVFPLAKADEWNKETTLTFNEAVEVPGKVLPAGTYLFRLVDSQSDRNIVQIFTADHRQLLATIMAIPAARLDIPDKTIVTFEERTAGSPEAIKTWFYPGDNYGLEFVYHKQPEMTGNSEPLPAPPAAANAAPVPEANPAPFVSENTADREVLPLESAPMEQEQQPAPEVTASSEEAQAMPPAAPQLPAEDLPAGLPQTAGNFAILPLMGAAFLAAGLKLRAVVRRHA